MTDTMTDQLKQLSEAATPGEWTPDAEFGETISFSDPVASHAFKEEANVALICALVNAYRAGELIPASEARAREAVAYEVAADEAERYAEHYQQGSDGRNTFVIFADLMRQKAAEANQ